MTPPGESPVWSLDARDNNIVYGGGADGRVWKSTNGRSGAPRSPTSQPSLAFGSLAIDPSNPDTIYAGTREENFSADAYTRVGDPEVHRRRRELDQPGGTLP